MAAIALLSEWVKRRRYCIFIFIVLFFFADFVTTYLGITLGVPELNPLMALAQKSWVNFFVVKAVGMGILLYSFFLLFSRYKKGTTKMSFVRKDGTISDVVFFDESRLEMEMFTWGIIIGIILFTIIINIISIAYYLMTMS